jgi:hypothetical protein
MWEFELDSGYVPKILLCEHSNESPNFIKGMKFVDQLRDFEVFKKILHIVDC